MTIVTCSTPSTQFPRTINQVLIFGDSLSDVGAVFRVTGGTYPPNPPYFQGRYSNGRVWVEYLTDRLNLSSEHIDNSAYGGATTGSDRNNLVPDLVTQVQTLLQQRSIASDGLSILWAGANDYLQGASSATVPVENILSALRTLKNAGATRFLVANLPDLGQLPATRTSANSSRLSALTQTHNQSLRRSLKRLNQEDPDLQIVLLEVDGLYRQAIATPSTYGLSNVTQACLSGSRICDRPDQFLFWDGIHPTTSAHRIIAEAAFSLLQIRLPLSPSGGLRGVKPGFMLDYRDVFTR